MNACVLAFWLGGLMSLGVEGNAQTPLGRSCLQDPIQGHFLWGCRDETPKNGFTKLARCWVQEARCRPRVFRFTATGPLFRPGAEAANRAGPRCPTHRSGISGGACPKEEELLAQCIAGEKAPITQREPRSKATLCGANCGMTLSILIFMIKNQHLEDLVFRTSFRHLPLRKCSPDPTAAGFFVTFSGYLQALHQIRTVERSREYRP